jgi:hypothetical protein
MQFTVLTINALSSARTSGTAVNPSHNESVWLATSITAFASCKNYMPNTARKPRFSITANVHGKFNPPILIFTSISHKAFIGDESADESIACLRFGLTV